MYSKPLPNVILPLHIILFPFNLSYTRISFIRGLAFFVNNRHNNHQIINNHQFSDAVPNKNHQIFKKIMYVLSCNKNLFNQHLFYFPPCF
ncbi:hypothetical protein X975_00583, partial [Stegodyphus mimosarum]